MKNIFYFLIFISIVGCKNDGKIQPLPPTEEVLAAPKNMLYAAFPFERDYSESGTDLRSCPNSEPTAQDLQFFSQSFNYIKGNTIVDIYPCYHGGLATTYSITPELPEGLVFSQKSGRIAGTPTQLRLTPNTFRITATNSVGSTSTEIRIQILDRLPVLRYESESISLIKSDRPFSYLPIVTGGGAETFSIQPTPVGFVFNNQTGRISGVSSQAIAKTTYTITVTNSGGVNSSSFTLDFEINPVLSTLISGKNHSCVIFDDLLRCWGGNSQGQLGIGDFNNTSILTQISNSPVFNPIGEVSLGNNYSCSLTQRLNDSVIDMSCWGNNSSLNFGATIEEDEGSPNFGDLNSPIPNGLYSTLQSSFSGLLLRVATSKGDSLRNTLVVYDTGLVKDFGEYSLGDYSSTDYNVQFNLANLDNILEVSSGDDFSCAVNNQGEVYCWGSNDVGQLGNGSTISSLEPVLSSEFFSGNNQAAEISAGKDFACATDFSNDVYCWGDNTYGQLGLDPNVTVNSENAVEIIFPEPAFEMVSGYNHSCSILADTTVACWGKNDFGQLGNGTQQNNHQPTLVLYDNEGVLEPLDEIQEISVGEDFSCALTISSEIYCWGKNDSNQLGNSVQVFSDIAVKIENLF